MYHKKKKKIAKKESRGGKKKNKTALLKCLWNAKIIFPVKNQQINSDQIKPTYHSTREVES